MSRLIDYLKGFAVSFQGRALPAVVLALSFVLLSSSSLPADEIYFDSGYSETGVVIRQTDSYVRFKTEMGLITVSREKVSYIEKASDEENQALLKKWREEASRKQEQLEEKREAERQYELQQIAKGLVNFEGEWISPERRKEILTLREEARADKREFERQQIEKGLVKFEFIWVTPAVKEQLVDIGEEIEKLAKQIDDDKSMLESLRSGMLNAPMLSDAEDLSRKMEDISERIEKNTKNLNLLFEQADNIEAVSVKYKTPEKYRDILPPEELSP